MVTLAEKRAEEDLLFVKAFETQGAFHHAVNNVLPPEETDRSKIKYMDPDLRLSDNARKRFEYYYTVILGDKQKVHVLAERSEDGLSFNVEVHAPFVDYAASPNGLTLDHLVALFSVVSQEKLSLPTVHSEPNDPLSGYMTIVKRHTYTIKDMPQLTNTIRDIGNMMQDFHRLLDSDQNSTFVTRV